MNPGGMSKAHHRSAPRKASNMNHHKINRDKQFCSYVHRVCLQNRLEGYDYCIRHILEDKNAPFRQCSFVHQQSGKRCTNAAPKSDKRESILCPWHSKKLNLSKMKLLKTRKKVKNLPALFAKLELYCSDPCHNKDPKDPSWTNFRSDADSKADDATCSDSGSELDVPNVDQAWKGTIDSDNESIDSEFEDPLKHAGIYTQDEVVKITCDKLVRLQSLYMEQLDRLRYMLKERKLAYLKALKQEKETMGSINSTKPKSLEEHVNYQKLKAMYHYHNYYGKEAILRHKRQIRKNSSIDIYTTKPPPCQSCIFQEKGVKCKAKVLPYARYCYKHILSDRQQVLYKRCSAGSEGCLNPVVPVLDKECCLLHVKFDKSMYELEKQWPLRSQQAKAAAGSDVEGLSQESDHFQFMDDITSLGLDVVQPGSLFGLNQFGDLGESTDSALSGEAPEDLMQPMALNATDILEENQKSPDPVGK